MPIESVSIMKPIVVRQVNEIQIHLSVILHCIGYFGGILNGIKVSSKLYLQTDLLLCYYTVAARAVDKTWAMAHGLAHGPPYGLPYGLPIFLIGK